MHDHDHLFRFEWADCMHLKVTVVSYCCKQKQSPTPPSCDISTCSIGMIMELLNWNHTNVRPNKRLALFYWDNTKQRPFFWHRYLQLCSRYMFRYSDNEKCKKIQRKLRGFCFAGTFSGHGGRAMGYEYCVYCILRTNVWACVSVSWHQWRMATSL